MVIGKITIATEEIELFRTRSLCGTLRTLC